MFGISLPPFLILSAMALELFRINYLQTHLALACDSGAIAAGRYDVDSYQTNGINFFNANFSQSRLGISVIPTFSLSNDKSTVTCSAKGTLPSMFSSLTNVYNLTTHVDTVARRQGGSSEVAIVMNSKGSATQVSGLTGVVNQFVNRLSKNTTSNNLAISLVPYSATINIDPKNTSWLTNPSDVSKFSKDQPWEGCVMATHTGLTMAQDDPPSVKKWPLYYAESTYNKFGAGVKADNDYTQTSAKTTIQNNISGVNVGPNRSCSTPIFPLSKNTGNLTSYINGIKATDGGGSFGDLGLLWGWNTLSPQWSGYWGGNVQPQPYGQAVKSIVLFTDGVNAWDDLAGYPPSTGDPNSYGSDLTRSTAGLLGATSTNFTGICTNLNAANCINARISDLCVKIKEKGIQIFTVDYGTSDTATITTYTNCATKPEWAFFPTDKKALQSAFDTISDALNTVRIIG
jgi:hypothetical protein